MPIQLRALLMFLLGNILFLGLPLLGWGVGSAGEFMAHPARLGYALFVVLCQAVLILQNPMIGRYAPEGKKTIDRQQWAVGTLQILSLAVVLGAPFCDKRGIWVWTESAWIRFAGLFLFGSGFILTSWAESHLGKQFSLEITIQEGHRLITDGPYRWIRHPRYLGIILFTLGLSLLFRSWLGLGITLLTLLILIWRIGDEEDLMAGEFAGEWSAYCRKSWRLIPFIY